MPYLTKPQMQLVREVAAEVARNTVNQTIDPKMPKVEKARGEAIGFFGSGIIDDISRIAAQTAHKTIGQIVVNNRAMQDCDKTVADCAARFTNHLNFGDPGFPLMVQSVNVLRGFYLRPIPGAQAGANDFCLSLKNKPLEYFSYATGEPQDGDIYFCGTTSERMTYFMGEWRRRSALEGFAAAKKYL